MRRLLRWPLTGRVKAVTYSFRLTVAMGEARTPLSQRTFPFTVIVEKGQSPDRIRKAVALSAAEIAAHMAEIMQREVLDALDEELRTK